VELDGDGPGGLVEAWGSRDPAYDLPMPSLSLVELVPA
jgi:hypothetical protein